MDSLQEQMSNLNTKVDALQGSLEQVGSQIVDILSELKGKERNHPSPAGTSPAGMNLGRYSQPSRGSFNIEMAHKDVLADDSYPELDSQNSDRILAPEVQIQRLTAQLTAAYNRIAALEEQLMSRRVM